ncbi:hypothetical protein DNTS_022173 [Danionella cerebrum]|uniref:CRIB domain-containing protein n=1 Tax=Danionella cerebrum TaxID=2873325 RepID=A0A553RGK2_9TELE|nr:hypothetical protein DNTS_024954 [Danionella translucida]TRZ01316.1 hypothetical protein DNTS_022173 [Danionella translucida]
MSTKAPIYLKRRSRKGKKEKLRDLLSSDMISPPLGDFRHTIHIGSGDDDLFGDLSFLQGKYHLLPGQQGHEGAFTLSRTASVSSHPAVSQSSPLLKNALSLPVIGGVQAITLPAASSAVAVTTAVPASLTTPPMSPSLAPPPKPPRLHLEERKISRHVSLPASPIRSPLNPRTHAQSPETMEDEKHVTDGDGEEKPYLSTAGSMLSLHLDLGPSILEDVLQIMDQQRTGAFSGGLTPSKRQEIYT